MCTGIIYKNIIGRTLDYEVPLYYHALHLPEGYEASQDLCGDTIITKNRMMGMIFKEHHHIKDGINEHGLAGITNLFHMIKPVFNAKIDENKLNLSSLDYLNYALGEYKSVRELRDDLNNINISSVNAKGEKIICPDFHFLFLDKEGESVIIEPKNYKLTAFNDETGVMTNSPPYNSQLRRYKKLVDEKFSPAKDIPGGFDPVSRFIRASVFKQSTFCNDAFLSTLRMLEAMQIPEGVLPNEKYNYYTFTRYISLFDTLLNKMYVKMEGSPELFSLSFDEIPKDDKIMLGLPKSQVPSLYSFI